MQKLKQIFSLPFWTDKRTLFGLWLLLPIIASLTKLHKYNNFLVFKYTFWHAWEGTSLYAEYPEQYADSNYYGPLFSLLIAPFAIQPVEWIGLLLWHLGLAMLLYWAIRKDSFTTRQQTFMLLFCAHELLTAIFMSQFNIAVVAMILLTYHFVRKEKDIWATLFIVIGTLVKLYGIVGLVFFLCSKHKGKFIVWLIIWSAILFCAPMLISSPEYVIDQYKEWGSSLVEKNGNNLFATHQNISLLGLIRKVGYALSVGLPTYRTQFWGEGIPLDPNNPWTCYCDVLVILPAMLLFALPLLRFKQWKNDAFWQTILASVLMFVCLFSSGSESSGYIIAFVGIVIWYTASPWKRSRLDIALMVFAFILTSLSPSDLMPSFLRRDWIQPFALKALPIAIIWLKLSYEMLNKQYDSVTCKK